ncbi:MAG: ArsR family transcriptional regulator [Candidatus Hodarchaeales archaeon]
MSSNKFLINEISNPVRLEILQKLYNSPVKFTDLAKEIGISNSEVSRHLTRLTEQGFVEKELGTRNFKLAPLGKIVTTLFLPVQFVLEHADYFRTHDLDLPISFLRDLDSLSESSFIKGTGNVMLKIQKLIEGADNEIWIMTDQQFPFGKPGLDMSYLVTQKLVELGKEVKVEDLNRSSRVVILAKISLALIVIDSNKGMVFFSDLQGNPDYSSGFYVDEKDLEGVEYIKRIWSFYWDKGERVV